MYLYVSVFTFFIHLSVIIHLLFVLYIVYGLFAVRLLFVYIVHGAGILNSGLASGLSNVDRNPLSYVR